MTTVKKLLIFLWLCLIFKTSSAQKLRDTSYTVIKRMELGDHYMKKGRSQKAAGYALLGGGALLLTASFGLALEDFFLLQSTNEGLAATTAVIGLGCFSAAYPVLAAGAKNKGRAEMLYIDPDPEQSKKMAATYRRKARNASIMAWSLLGSGFIVPIALKNMGNGDYSKSGATETISAIASLGIFVSIPFFMEAGKNKGRFAILTRSESLPFSYLQGQGKHQSIGIGIPIGR